MVQLTPYDIIDRVDDMEPNFYSDEYKLSWLYEIETILWQEIFTTHEGAEGMEEPEEFQVREEENDTEGETQGETETQTETQTETTEEPGEGTEETTEEAEESEEEEERTLLVPVPYGRDIYENYLKAKISQANGETGRYNEYMTLFNSAYQLFANYWNRTHESLGPTFLWL